MRIRYLIGATVTIVIGWQVSSLASAASCVYIASYPPAIGHHSFLLATATADQVMAPLDKPFAPRARPVPAQVMAVHDVAGSLSEEVAAAVRTNGGTAAFVRYRIDTTCEPVPAFDGAFDTAGVSGLYVGRPRPVDRWVDGHPTFDVFQAHHYPLPQRLVGAHRILRGAEQDTTPSMTASELFTMYRALWAESATVGDTMVGVRLRRWLQEHPVAARKWPGGDVAYVMLKTVETVNLAARPVPFGGTFAVTVIVPGVDSFALYGQRARLARTWTDEVLEDSVTGISVAILPVSYAVDLSVAPTLEEFHDSPRWARRCHAPIIVTALPVVPAADSTWQGTVWPGSLLQCAPPGFADRESVRAAVPHNVAVDSSEITFRRHADGRVTFETAAAPGERPRIILRGVQAPTAPDSTPLR